MREERGHVKGNIVIDEPYTLWGSIAGNVTAVKGSKFYMRGAIYGEPRLFPATSPNAIAGECAVLYPVTGPSLAVGGGLIGALVGVLDAAALV